MDASKQMMQYVEHASTAEGSSKRSCCSTDARTAEG